MPPVQTRSIRYAGHGGLNLAADVLGNDAGQCVLLIPGAGQTRHAWHHAAHRLATLGHQVIALDLRGHGDSDWAADHDYSIEAFVQDIYAVVAQCQRPPVIVGASIGGIAALIAAGESRPFKAAALVLVDVVARMDTDGLNHIRSFMSAGRQGFVDIVEASRATTAFLPHRTAPASAESLRRNLRQKADGRYYWHWDPAFHEGSAGRAGMFERMERAAAGVDVSTLLLRGQRSEVVNEDGLRHLCQLIPHAQIEQIEDAAHMVAGDRNDAFVAAIENFILRLAALAPVQLASS